MTSKTRLPMLLATSNPELRAGWRAVQHLDAKGWQDAILRTEALLTKQIDRLQDEGKGNEAFLLNLGLDLQAEVLSVSTTDGLSAPARTTAAVKKTASALTARLVHICESAIRAAEPKLRAAYRQAWEQEQRPVIAALEEKVKAASLAPSFQMSLDLAQSAATTAQAEAVTACRERDALKSELQQLQQSLATAQAEAGQLTGDLQAELLGVRQERDHLQAEVDRLTAEVQQRRGQHQQQLEALQAQFAQLEAEVLDMKTRPQSPAPAPVATVLAPAELPEMLELHSWVIFLRANNVAAVLDGRTVVHGLPAAREQELRAAWTTAIRDESAALEQIRQIIRPILRRVA